MKCDKPYEKPVIERMEKMDFPCWAEHLQAMLRLPRLPLTQLKQVSILPR